MKNEQLKKVEVKFDDVQENGQPSADPSLSLVINDRPSQLKIADLKKWVDALSSNESDNPNDATEAKKQLENFFTKALSPFINERDDKNQENANKGPSQPRFSHKNPQAPHQQADNQNKR